MPSKQTDMSFRSPNKRWSSIISPSLFRKSSADHVHRFSMIDSAGTSADVKRMFRAKRFASAGDETYDDPWEMRSSSCCEFDRLRTNLALEADPEHLNSLFERLYNFSLKSDSSDELESSSDTDMSSFVDGDQSISSETGSVQTMPRSSADHTISYSALPYPIVPPPKPARSSRRPVLNRLPTSLTTLNEQSVLELSESRSELSGSSPAVSQLNTPPLEPSYSNMYSVPSCEPENLETCGMQRGTSPLCHSDAFSSRSFSSNGSSSIPSIDSDLMSSLGLPLPALSDQKWNPELDSKTSRQSPYFSKDIMTIHSSNYSNSLRTKGGIYSCTSSFATTPDVNADANRFYMLRASAL